MVDTYINLTTIPCMSDVASCGVSYPQQPSHCQGALFSSSMVMVLRNDSYAVLWHVVCPVDPLTKTSNGDAVCKWIHIEQSMTEVSELFTSFPQDGNIRNAVIYNINRHMEGVLHACTM